MKESIKVRLKQLQRISGRIFRSRLLVLTGVFCLTSSMLVCRCFYLQIIKGEEYAEEYELRIKKTEEIKATRGNIYDRNGNLLAYNELAYSITIEDPTSSDSTVSERNETINAILEQVLEIVEENGDSVINSFGITLDSSGNYQFSQTNETQRLRFVADVYGYSSADDLTDEQKNQTADDIIEYLCTDEIYGYGLDYSGSDPGYILDMVNMRYAMHLNSYQKYMSTTIATGVSRETAAAVMENKDVLTGILDSGAVDYSDDTYTEWSQGNISLYAYLNYAISRNWINTVNLSGSSYSSSAEIYQAILDYIEEYIESDSGLDRLIYENLIQDGTVTGAQICAIVYEQGVLDMDEDLYGGLRAGTVSAYNWLCDRIENLDITPGQLALEPCSGGAVVTDPGSGEVLSCVSYPGYDNNRLANTMDTDYYNDLVSGMNNIFYNRATQEKTAPGSTYKMVSAVAALTEGVIDSGSTVYCSGEFTKVTPSPKCWIYPNAHGSLNVVGALEHSCNDFFYEVGYRLAADDDGIYDSDLGTDTLAKYAEMFGLGETSGIEITEAEPEISDEYAVQSAIGQGTNNFTVSQLARYVSEVSCFGAVPGAWDNGEASGEAGNGCTASCAVWFCGSGGFCGSVCGCSRGSCRIFCFRVFSCGASGSFFPEKSQTKSR